MRCRLWLKKVFLVYRDGEGAPAVGSSCSSPSCVSAIKFGNFLSSEAFKIAVRPLSFVL